ncbi:MAG: diguanylate cyclase [Magnetococcales bacterium]|nr:diguanylate cyclase [Magnetococcales bacterium]
MADILVVDDDSQAIEQGCRLLVEMGHTYDFLLESKYLIAKMESRSFDLVLLDVNMPDVDGLTLLKQLKFHSTLSKIPVIMVTGETGEGLVSRCFEMGAVDFINKPIRPLDLQSRVRIALETQAHILSIHNKSEALRQAKAFSDAILNSMEEALLVLDRVDFLMIEVNQVFLEQMQVTRQSLIGQPCHATANRPEHPCYPCSGYGIDCLLNETLKTGKMVTQEIQHADENSQTRYTKIITTPIRQEGRSAAPVLLVARDVTKARLLQDRLKHMAFHDVLTGLPNRQLFYDRIYQSLAMSRRYNKMMAVMFFDLDRFKVINDTLGHDIGDLLLVEVAKRLVEGVRQSDTIARMGGDEFTAVLNEVDDIAQVQKVARKILQALAAEFCLGEHRLTITTSIGISLFPQDGKSMEELTKHADKALYQAKGAGRNTVRFYSAQPDSAAASP